VTRNRSSNPITDPRRAQSGVLDWPAGAGKAVGGGREPCLGVAHGGSARWVGVSGGGLGTGAATRSRQPHCRGWVSTATKTHIRWGGPTSSRAGRRRTLAALRGCHPSGAGLPAPTAADHVPGPPRIESGAGLGCAGGLARVRQDRVERRRVDHECNDAHLAPRTGPSAQARCNGCAPMRCAVPAVANWLPARRHSPGRQAWWTVTCQAISADAASGTRFSRTGAA
jgi:hypothetical protein